MRLLQATSSSIVCASKPWPISAAVSSACSASLIVTSSKEAASGNTFWQDSCFSFSCCFWIGSKVTWWAAPRSRPAISVIAARISAFLLFYSCFLLASSSESNRHGHALNKRNQKVGKDDGIGNALCRISKDTEYTGQKS